MRAGPTRGACALLSALLVWPALAVAQVADAGAKELFNTVQPQCSVCHALAAAGATGTVGPDLDELKPTEERVAKAVREGLGAMPSYRDKLKDEQIAALARYVARVAGAPR
jgi:mono/diheme cytochrome c family protein